MSHFCPNCGTPVQVGRSEQSSDRIGMPMIKGTDFPREVPNDLGRYTEQLRSFVKENSRYYMNKWRVMDNTTGIGGVISWNWSAFIVPIGWLGFRRMYLMAFIASVAFACLTVPTLAWGFPQAVSWVLSLLVSICFGLLGNALYRKFVDRQIKVFNLGSEEGTKPAAELAEKGGQSALGAIGAGAMNLAIIIGIGLMLYGDAGHLLNSSINLLPTPGLDEYNKGVHYQQSNQVDLAEQQFKLAIERNQNLAESYLNLGLIYLNRTWYDGAEQMTNRCVEILKNNGYTIIEGGSLNQTLSIAYNNLGVIYMGRALQDETRGDYSTAKSRWKVGMDYLHEALRLDPANSMANVNIQTYGNAY